MCLLKNRAQMMSKCDENKKVAYKGHLKVSVMLLLQLKQTHSNMKSTFFKIIKQKKKVNGEVIYRYTKTVSFSTHG